jgi:hypothetical protein
VLRFDCPWRLGTAGLLLFLAALTGAEGLQAPPKPAPAKPAPAAPTRSAAKAPPITTLVLTVTGPAGKPVEGAVVVVVPVVGAFLPSGSVSSEKLRSAVTGREGGARLDALPPGPWHVTVKARGLVPRTLRRVASGPLAVRLEKGGSITGVVRDGATSRPVAKARVAIDAERQAPSAWSDDPTRNETATDAQGRFRLDGIGVGVVTLAARAPGFARAERTGVRAGANVELFLFPGASLAGLVRDDDGRPVPGATVRAEADQGWGAPPPERTDARGEFRMAGVREGEYTVVAREGGRAPGFAVAVVEPEGEATVSVVLSEGGYATGRIVDAERRPLAGRVRLDGFAGRSLPEFASDVLTAQARADGTFALGPLPLGSLSLDVSAPRHVSRQVTVEIGARGRAPDLGDLVLDRGLSIAGRVRERGGRPLAGVSLRAERHGAGESSEAEAASEDDGAFLLAGLGSGRHDVTASAAGYVAARSIADAGGEPVELVLEPGGQIEGRVVDGDGDPVDNAFVSAEEQSRSQGSASAVFEKAEDGSGRFTLRDVAAGTYALYARAEGRGQGSLAGVRVAAGRSTNVGTITLERGGVVRGVVVDAEGAGIPGALVSAERDANRRRGPSQTQSGSNGAFELAAVPLGPVRVRAWHPAYAPSRDVATTVEAEGEPAPLRLVLGRGGRVEGRALLRDGRPFAAGRVSCYSTSPENRGIGSEMVPIGPDGGFVVEHAMPGRAMLQLMAFASASPMMSGPSENILSSVVSRELEVREGETTQVDLTLRDVVVEGRVTRGAEPEPGVVVSVMSADGSSMMTWMGPRVARVLLPGPQPLAATTREDGRYELLVFAPGRAYVEVVGGGKRHAAREVEIPDADRFELDIALGAASVSGIVVDRESGSPVPEVSLSLRRADGSGDGGGGESGADGRFTIAAEPGEYDLYARAPDRAPATQRLSVGTGGLSDVRVELERGQEIRGRLADGSGRAAAGFRMLATTADGERSGSANSGPDGAFRIAGLAAKPYGIFGGSELAGYAVRSSVLPGGDPLTLTLQPAGRVVVRVVDAASQPVPNAFPRVETVDGVLVRMVGRSGPTDPDGVFTLSCPAGVVEVVVRDAQRMGRASVPVAPGASVPLTVVLSPQAAKTP